jgi:transcriptional regulator with XRE-family HTH domain
MPVERPKAIESEAVRKGRIMEHLIAGALKRKGWTKTDLARAMGKDADSGYRLIRKWETGEREPDRDSLALLARALDMTIDELVSCLEEREPSSPGWRAFAARRSGTLSATERGDLMYIAIRRPDLSADRLEAILRELRRVD